MQIKEQFTISSMMTKQLIEKYNAQNAKYPVEYVELVLDDESGTEIIGPRTLDLIESGNPYRGMFLRLPGNADSVVMVQFIRLMKMHKDFCRVEVVYDDDPHYLARYAEFRRD